MAALAALALAGCASREPLPSMWPPDDFYVEMRGIVTEVDSTGQTQSFRVWADGTAVYREASRFLGGVPLLIPVYDQVSAYRMERDSIRTLGRLLSRAGLFDSEPQVLDPVDLRGQHVVLHWRAFEASGELSSQGTPLGSLDRSVRIVNSFLPRDHEIRYDDLAGEIEPAHLSGVPEPRDSVSGSLAFHRELVAEHPGEPMLRLELLALALEAGDAEEARRALGAIEALGPSELILDFDPQDVDWERDLMAPLRALVLHAAEYGRRGTGKR